MEANKTEDMIACVRVLLERFSLDLICPTEGTNLVIHIPVAFLPKEILEKCDRRREERIKAQQER